MATPDIVFNYDGTAVVNTDHGMFVIERHTLNRFDRERTGETYGYVGHYHYTRKEDGARITQWTPGARQYPTSQKHRLEFINGWVAGIQELHAEIGV